MTPFNAHDYRNPLANDHLYPAFLSPMAILSGPRREKRHQHGGVSRLIGKHDKPQISPTGRSHVPVMLAEVLQCLDVKPGEVIIDGTFGAGGYSAALLQAGARVVAIDRDMAAINAGAEMVKNADGALQLMHGRFADLDALAGDAGHRLVDGVVLDVGVSSMQFDQQQRGFSFQNDGPLDMRMGQTGLTAAELLNQVNRANLTRIIGLLGEERQASRLSKAIIARRDKNPFSRTGELVDVILQAVGHRQSDRIHPATRTFQALRIFINSELPQLAAAMFAAERILRPGGRLVVVAFHSLEDRIVKRFMIDRCSQKSTSRHMPEVKSDAPTFSLIQRGALLPGRAEIASNPRARSARLRAAIRLDVTARQADLAIFKLADFSGVSEISDEDLR